jgi:hypothetical protein
VYGGGHEDRGFPFMENSETEVVQIRMMFSFFFSGLSPFINLVPYFRMTAIDEITEVSVLELYFCQQQVI